jgi:hypothetical protein
MGPAKALFLLFLAVCAIAGCGGRQLYGAGTGWRQAEGQKMLDNAERERCLRTANTDYDTYEKEKKRPEPR